MSEETPQVDDRVEPAIEPAAAPETAPERSRRRFLARWLRRLLALVVAVVTAFVVSFFTIDLGRLPGVREMAERQGTNYLERPFHVGRISAYVAPGRFALHDVVIDGKHAGDRPFMTIERIDIEVPWWTLIERQLHVNVTLERWAMVVETWTNGEHNIPKLMPKTQGTGRRSFTTTVDFAYARNGHFIYDDHVTPWTVSAPNLNFGLVRANHLGAYVGLAYFSGGTVKIQGYQPMDTSMSTRFVLDGPRVQLQHIDLVAEGSVSHINGQVDFSTRPTPTQTYNVNSTIDFSRMKDIFFAKEAWRLGGEGEFTGIFKLFPGGRDLSGDFTSNNIRVNEIEFPDLHGSLQWTPTKFVVTHADGDLLGGHTRFNYSIAPLGSPGGSTATFRADYTDLDLFELDRLMSLRGLRIAGRASGSLEMQWPNGGFRTGRIGSGVTFITPLPGVLLAPTELPVTPRAFAYEPTPFDADRRTGPLSLGANLTYQFDGTGVTFEDSWAATSHSFIAFKGRMASQGSSEFPFHVTSHDWQESDRLLAASMTAISGPTRAIEVGGRGTFDGAMTGTFSAPRIAGKFTGDAMRVWDVTWGRASADLVIEGGYVDISNARVGDADRTILPTGRFALGFRRDDQEEIKARVQIANWPVSDLRHAFLLDDWPMDGTVAAADLNLSGKYKEMFGAGTLRIDKGQAWNEPFDSATGGLVLEGTGMRVTGMEIRKGPGVIRGAARIGWDGTYAFNADGEGVPVESLENFRIEGAPLSGQLKFRVSGASEFDTPTYTFDASIEDLFVGDEGVGSVTGRATYTKGSMTVERLVAASSRLQVFGSGTIGFDENYTSDIRLIFSETALDPYLKFVLANDIQPYTRIIVGGSLDVKGPLKLPRQLDVDARIDTANLTLFDYALRNNGQVQLTARNGDVDIVALALSGDGTNLRMSGRADATVRTLDLSATGDANLAVLRLFPQFNGISASGTASLNASLTGSFDAPRFGGEAELANGRIRPMASPHGLEAVNGRIELGANAVTLEGMTGRVGNGDVEFGGTIALDGYRLTEMNLAATGRSMRLRYPEGFTSTVDMNLFLVGPATSPRLTGTIDVLRMALRPSLDGSGLFGLPIGGGDDAAAASLPAAETVSGVPIALDIQVTAPRMMFVNSDEYKIEGQADLAVRGTFDRPSITGVIDVVGGEIYFGGNRWVVREGEIAFRNPDTMEPTFYLTAETRTRLQGDSYTLTASVSGTGTRSLSPTITSEPFLPPYTVIQIAAGGAPNVLDVEERQTRSSEELQQQMLQALAAVILTRPLTSFVGSTVQRARVFDSVQLTPVLAGESAFRQVDASARITVNRRISSRLFLTYSRTVGPLKEEVIVLEYDQSERLSWILSRNEEGTFALDFRIRYTF